MSDWNVDRFPWHPRDAYVYTYDVGELRWRPCTGVARSRTHVISIGSAAEDHHMWSYRRLPR